jgi:hypothetical protein
MAPLPIAILLDKERSKIGRVPVAKPRQKENAPPTVIDGAKISAKEG